MINPSSRYHDLAHLRHLAEDGREILYLERRFIPSTPVAGKTTNAQSERLDLIAERTLGNPELYWRLCDANEETNPFVLSETSGRTLKLPSL